MHVQDLSLSISSDHSLIRVNASVRADQVAKCAQRQGINP